MRRAAVVCVAFWLVSALFLGIGAIAANPSDDAESGLVGRVGDERRAAGLGGYVVAADLVEVARRHAEDMRRQQRLHHNPSLGDDVHGWQAVGENVGVGPTSEAIHQKLMDSPTHRDNILSRRFTEIGVGVVVDGADLWVVQVFRLPQSSSAPAPADGTGTEAGSSGSPSGSASGGAAGPSPSASPPEPRPAPAGGGGATARAAVAPVAETPTTLAEASPMKADTVGSGGEAVAPASGTVAGTTLVDDDGPTTSARQVTWPVALAATMLLGVVTALAVHVTGHRLRALAAAGRRTSVLDVGERALAG